MKTQTPSTSERLAKLRQTFVSKLPSMLEAIRTQLESLGQDSPDRQTLEELHRRIHSLKGASASFGFKPLSLAAEAGELLTKRLLAGQCSAGTEWRALMVEHLERVGFEISVVDTAAYEEILDVETTVADATRADREMEASAGKSPQGAADADRPERECRLVYICEDDPFQLTSLATQIGCFGFDVRAFQDLEEFHQAVRDTLPDVIVMDLVHPGRKTGGAEVVREIEQETEFCPPVVYISSESDIHSRLAAVRAGASAYFVKPVNMAELCAKLTALTNNDVPEPCRVLIVEDDVYLSGMYAAYLQDAGMETMAVTDPLRSLICLEEFQPDLILMDMHMPGCNGLELSKAIRQIEAYLSIPIVFLSSETDPDMHIDARRMGGDEFLIKPIRPEHLVASVSVRAQRMKLLRSLMIRDSMTGLFNHSTIKEQLELSILRARRSGEKLCFAMIDLDHFKTINDTYGHPMGDRVLVGLASLLRQRLRKSDVMGRYGGEEFAVILPGCALDVAAQVLDKLRECFTSLKFMAGDKAFSATFSCGVSEMRSTCDRDKLCKEADEALYRAKREGRNRVVRYD